MSSTSSPSSPGATSTGSSTLRVSLAGQGPGFAHAAGSEESLTAALDDAMEKLNAVAGSSVPVQHVPIQDTTGLFQLIEAMSSARSRRAAAEKLVEFLATHSTSAGVRCGLGRGRMTHLFDSRLGWLGPESSLHRESAAKWEPQQRRAEDPQVEGACVMDHEESIEIQLPQPGGSGRCVVWVEKAKNNSGPVAVGDPKQTGELSWMHSRSGVIGSVLWSRPMRSLPSIAVRMARHTSMSLAAAAILLIVLAVWPVPYRVACTARVETTQQRMIATPFEATLLTAHVKPGDTVKAGDVLVELDGRPLRIEREAIEAEIQQVAKEHDVALATRRIAESQQAALKKQQLIRQHELLSDRLGRLKVASPIDGVVVSGDLEKFVGSPLERGQTLIEVAPMNRMVIEVEIPEYEIGYVEKGAATRVKLDAIGGKSIRMPLSDVFPSAELRDDHNVFIGRIQVDNGDHKLKPGMRGEATTYGPLRPWVWSWVRGGVERTLWWIGY